jgi:hypothetical protein
MNRQECINEIYRALRTNGRDELGASALMYSVDISLTEINEAIMIYERGTK